MIKTKTCTIHPQSTKPSLRFHQFPTYFISSGNHGGAEAGYTLQGGVQGRLATVLGGRQPDAPVLHRLRAQHGQPLQGRPLCQGPGVRQPHGSSYSQIRLVLTDRVREGGWVL